MTVVKSCPALFHGKKLHLSFCKAENLLSTPWAFSLPRGSDSGPEDGLEKHLCNSEHHDEGSVSVHSRI